MMMGVIVCVCVALQYTGTLRRMYFCHAHFSQDKCFYKTFCSFLCCVLDIKFKRFAHTQYGYMNKYMFYVHVFERGKGWW